MVRLLCNRVLVNFNEIKAKVNNFVYEIGYNFVNKALKEASNVLVAYVYNPDKDQRKSMLCCEKKFSIPANHYGNEIFKECNGDNVHTNCLM